jgi:pimeloyl-ACP methyl ester carboxylesterase
MESQTSLFYKVHSQGRPIIMLHGWSFDHNHMVTALEPCFQDRDGWQRIYLDMPGHGQSAAMEGINNMDDVLDAILKFIDDVIPGQRFVLAGMSAGGYLAQGVVHQKGGLVDGLLLFAPRILADDAQRILPPQVTLVENPELLAELPANETESMQGAVIQSQEVVDRMRSDVYPAWALTNWDLLQTLWDPENWGLSIDVRAMPEALPFPALFVTGRQDAVVGYQDTWSLIESYPRGTFAALDRAGHGLEVDQEPLFHALVNEWLDRVEEFVD